MSERIYRLQWTGVENAQTYRVYRSITETGNKQELGLTSKTTFDLNTYIPGSSDYYYFIKAQATGYQDSDFSSPLRWKTFSISRSVDTGVTESSDAHFVGEGFEYNTGFIAPDGKIFNEELCLLTIGGVQHPEYITFVTGDKAFNISIPASAVTGDIIYSAITEDEQEQLTAPTIAMNSDGKTLEITDVENATSYDVYVDGILKTNVARVVSSTLTFVGATTDFLGGSQTYAKIGSAPTSNSDYQYSYSKQGAYEFTGSVDVYVWGTDGANSGGYAIDSTSQESMIKVNAWGSPTKLTFTETKSLCLFKAEMM